MEGAIGSRLLKAFGRGVHGLSGGGEGTCSQRLDMLGVANFGTCVDHFLASFEELLSELSELKHFSFNERVPQSSYSAVDELLIRLTVFE